MSYEDETDIHVPKKVYAGLAAVRDHLAEKGLAKNQTNSHQGFKFRGIDDLYGVLQQALQASGVVMIPNLGSVERKEAPTSKGTLAVLHNCVRSVHVRKRGGRVECRGLLRW